MLRQHGASLQSGLPCRIGGRGRRGRRLRRPFPLLEMEGPVTRLAPPPVLRSSSAAPWWAWRYARRRTQAMEKRDVPGIYRYNAPAGGWGALKATAKAVAEQMHLAEAPLLLLRTNQPDGFDCPGCAWPDKDHTSTFQFCENGAKAVTWEATKKRVPPEFFAAHTVTELLKWSDYELENEGRLTHPMAYDARSDTYKPISWDSVFARIGEVL